MTNLQKWFLIVAFWVIILALIFVFYWLRVRPVNIRKVCAQKATIASQGIKGSVSSINEIYRAVYSDCCRSNGLKE